MESIGDANDANSEIYLPKEVSYSLSSNGTKFVDAVLDGPNESCLENFRMDKHVFYKLCDLIKTRGLLRNTNRIKIEEQVAMFVFILGRNLRTRAVQELFRYSSETISRHFNNVLNAIMRISLDLFKPPGPDVPPEIQENPQFYPFFKDCVGVVDGIHLPVTVGVDEQGPFRDKNGCLSQHVIAAVTFDMKFHYVLAGWEGSATDIRVLNSALTRRNKLQVPDGKYYLVDAKYANIPGFIVPYPDASCDFLVLDNDFLPRNAKKLFNRRHSLLRSVSVRTFEALKTRFPILMAAPSYPVQTQVKLVIAACALHNFIREENPEDSIFKIYDQAPLEEEEEVEVEVEEQPMPFEPQVLDVSFETQHLDQVSQLRDSIASEIWNAYLYSNAFPSI